MKTRLILLFSGLLILMQANAHVNLIYPVGGEAFNVGETVNIQWEIVISHNTENWDLFYSGDGGNSWVPLELDISIDSLNYHWVVPNTPTLQGQIRIVMDNVDNDYDDNSENFTIEGVTAINNPSLDYGLRVFPNPMTTYSTIAFTNPDNEKHSLILFNAQGQAVVEKSNITSDQVIIKRNNLVSGLYFFQLSSSSELRAIGKININ